jgi:hypothetical protein
VKLGQDDSDSQENSPIAEPLRLENPHRRL